MPRPSKGERESFHVKLETGVAESVRERARAVNVTVQEWIEGAVRAALAIDERREGSRKPRPVAPAPQFGRVDRDRVAQAQRRLGMGGRKQ